MPISSFFPAMQGLQSGDGRSAGRWSRLPLKPDAVPCAYPSSTAAKLPALTSGGRVLHRALVTAAAVLALLTSPAPVLWGHVLNITRLRVTFGSAPTFQAHLAVDLTNLIGSTDAYYQLSLLPS